jgi:hypothetical protein
MAPASDGDDNYNGAVTARYRVAGTAAWRQGLPLYRVHPETAPTWPIAPQFSGSIFDLRPNTTYEIELHAVPAIIFSAAPHRHVYIRTRARVCYQSRKAQDLRRRAPPNRSTAKARLHVAAQ